MPIGSIKHLADKGNIWKWEEQKFIQLSISDQNLDA